jgi:hypothetical protein
MFNGNIHYKWSFSIAMLNYQRVSDGKQFAIEIVDLHIQNGDFP